MDEITDPTEFLAHYGVKGMKWGTRRTRAQRKVDRYASKDAKEYVDAKQFYGQGAGNRRKLIKGTVEQRKKKMSGYAEAFDKAVEGQDLAKASTKAVRKRKRTDRTTRTKQQAGAVARRATGEWGTQAAFVAVAASGLAFMNSPKGRAITNQVMTKVQKQVPNAQEQGADYLANWLKNQE